MKPSALLLSLPSLAASTCIHGTTLFPRHDSGSVPVATFNYDGLTGPLSWHALDEANALCATGREQSPTVIYSDTYDSVPGSCLAFSVDEYYRHGAEFENLGSTIEVIVNGSMRSGGKEYSLRQFHFHTPSEHRIDSEYSPMEGHWVFQAEDESLAVVGIMIEIGSSHHASPLLTSLFRSLDDISTPGTKTDTGPLDFRQLERHVARSRVYTYSGSLTTPPCSEGVAWHVVSEPIYVGLRDFNRVKGVLKFNSRYTQNAPGEVNLLDHARVTMEGGGCAR